MRSKTVSAGRGRALVALGALLLAAMLMCPTPRTAAAPGADPTTDPAADQIAAAYRSAFPGLTPRAAWAAAAQQSDRRQVVSVLAGHEDSFGGAWFDAPGGVLHLAVTTEAARARAADLAHRLGVRVGLHRVARSFVRLQQQADALRAGMGQLGAAARGQVGIDVITNEVVVALPANRLTTEDAPPGVRIVPDPGLPVEMDVCTSRTDCDDSIRAGSILWRGAAGNSACSVGFTARDNHQQRFVLTAGHCHDGNTSSRWGVGLTNAGAFGQILNSRDSGAIDASVITMDLNHPRYSTQRGGEIYSQTSSGMRIPISSQVPTLQSIIVGEPACLSANFADPTGPNVCGQISSVSDAGNRGLVRVSGIDACPGDSGGGWYTPVSVDFGLVAGEAIGVHSRSLNGCRVGTNPVSWFGALPLIFSSMFVPGLSVERSPVFD